jgi:hypothetical protein
MKKTLRSAVRRTVGLAGAVSAFAALAGLGAQVAREADRPAAAEGGEKPAPAPTATALTGSPSRPPPDAPVPACHAFAFEARLTDGGALKLAVKTARIDLSTPYGKLAIPFADIRRLDIGVRLTAAEEQRIDEAVAGLGAEDFDRRETASAELAALGEKSHAAVERASRHEDPEVAQRAIELLDKLRDGVPAERFPRGQLDVVTTAESMIAGRIEAASLLVTTAQFGELELRLADVRELRLPGNDEPEPGGAIPDPGNLANFQNQVGKVLAIRLTGAVKQGGSVWGTDIYTMDSNLAMAAVHAGALKSGQTKVVQVRILGQTNGFSGSIRNGVSTQNYGGFPAAYEFVKAKAR